MRINLKSPIRFSLAILIFSVSCIHLAQGMDTIDIVLSFPSGMKEWVTLNPNQSLSELRSKLTDKNKITPEDIFQKDGIDISSDCETKWTIQYVAKDSTLYFKPKNSILTSPTHNAKASSHKQAAGFNINPPPLEIEQSLKEETSVAPTTDMVSYADLSAENRSLIFYNLKLRHAINLKEACIDPSFIAGVIWEQLPEYRFPLRELEVRKKFSLSKMRHELKRSNIKKVTSDVNYLGISADTEYESKNETLSRQQRTEIYLLAAYNVKKIELSIQKKFIKAVPELEQEIEQVLLNENKSIDAYKKLLDIFYVYGFCVPTKFILGGQIYCEDKKEVISTDAAKDALTSFSASVDASFVGGSFFGAGLGYADAKATSNTSVTLQHTIAKAVTGGDVGLANDSTRWISSMGAFKMWRVIGYGGFYPITDFLTESLKTRCISLIQTYYTGDMANVSLVKLQTTYDKAFNRSQMPPMVRGHEDFYERFLKGELIYRPQEGSKDGEVILPIAALENPLEGTFDLSKCGDADKYLQISTGFRRKKYEGNGDKLEIWLTPRFLIETELETNAKHFQGVFSNWSNKVQVGIIWTWGGWDDLEWCDYLIKENMDNLSTINLYKNWQKSITTVRWFYIGPYHPFRPLPLIINRASAFYVRF